MSLGLFAGAQTGLSMCGGSNDPGKEFRLCYLGVQTKKLGIWTLVPYISTLEPKRFYQNKDSQ